MRRSAAVVVLSMFWVSACASAPPDVAGKELAFARGAMDTAGVEYDVEYETTDEVPVGTVIRTEEQADGPLLLVVAETPTHTITGAFALVDSDGVHREGAGRAVESADTTTSVLA